MGDARLRIAIDGRELLGRPTGVGRYLFEILKCWRKVERHEFTIIVPGHASAPAQELGERFNWIVEPSDTAGTVWEQLRLPRALRQLRPDVLFSPAYTAPMLAPCPFVVTIHDVSFFAHPEWFNWREGLRRRWLTRAAARRAATVLTVSEFSRREIVRYLRIADDQVVVARNAMPTALSEPHGGRAKSVLYVGSLFNRRRIPDVIEAFAEAAETIPAARLTLVGDNRTAPPVDPAQLASSAGVGNKFEWLEYVDDARLKQLYDAARVFVFLSDYEGFALTPLEAIAHGVPPVLLDTPISREIYGDAARFVPPNKSLIAAAIRDLLNNDHAHADLVRAGRTLLGKYSWQQTADRVLDVIETAARSR